MEESAANVERELAAQLKQANRFTDDVNGAYAKLMSAFYTVQAARLGVTPEEMYVRYPVQIRAESPLGGAVRMEQGGTSTRTDTANAKGKDDTARFSTAQGEVYQGAAPTIEIDGAARPTMSSDGKPIYSIETIDVEKPTRMAPSGDGIERGMGVDDVATTATGGLSDRVAQVVQGVNDGSGDTLLQRAREYFSKRGHGLGHIEAVFDESIYHKRRGGLNDHSADVATGRGEPTDPLDAARDVVTGTASPESKR